MSALSITLPYAQPGPMDRQLLVLLSSWGPPWVPTDGQTRAPMWQENYIPATPFSFYCQLGSVLLSDIKAQGTCHVGFRIYLISQPLIASSRSMCGPLGVGVDRLIMK